MASSMPEPASFGGYGRQTGIYGGLDGIEFAARCPPDVQKGTRIVAVCGIPLNKAAPQNDGWFFSDFFLFYQMLRHRDELPNQLWLSSCSPSDLVRQHGRYLHGPATGVAGDRRVVMDETLLPRNEMSDGFRVIQPKDLLERFLATVRDEVREAARRNQPVLILIFGHGEQQASGIFLGCGDGGTQKLKQAQLAAVLQKEVQTTMILTSCYSGGWIISPNANKKFDVKPAFNKTILTAAGYENMSLSWSLSQSIGRQAGGSVFASCLINSLITASNQSEGVYSRAKFDTESSKYGQPDNEETLGKLVKVREDDEGEEFSLSMAALTQQIVYECEVRYGSLWDQHNFSFAAQDDLWSKAWGERTGLPLLGYKERWESLPDAPPTKEVYPTAGPLTGSIMSKSSEALHNIVKVKAIRYMNSNPGLDNAGCNTDCHPGFYRLIEGTQLDFDELYRLNEILDYRQGQIALAEIFCFALDISVPAHRQISKFDESEWKDSQLKQKRERDAERSKAAVELLDRFDEIWVWINKLETFDPPRYGQGYDYSKPITYLAALLAESPIPIQKIHEKLEDLAQIKLKDAQRAADSPFGRAVLNQPDIKTMRGRVYKSVSKLAYKLRSLSPERKSPRKEGMN